MAHKTLLYRDIDVRAVPAYGLAEATYVLGIPAGTLKSWLVGRSYKTSAGIQPFEPLIQPARLEPLRLSFINLVECHVLATVRRHRRLTLGSVRTALRWVDSVTEVPHPLANTDFLTDRWSLFLEFEGKLVNASRSGQVAIEEIVRPYLERIDRDAEGLARRLFPVRFSRANAQQQPRIVSVDPEVSFGRPVLAGTGITTAVLAERHQAGESVNQIAEDYGRGAEEITQAIEWESQQAA